MNDKDLKIAEEALAALHEGIFGVVSVDDYPEEVAAGLAEAEERITQKGFKGSQANSCKQIRIRHHVAAALRLTRLP